MERSVIRGSLARCWVPPDCAPLHPGYTFCPGNSGLLLLGPPCDGLMTGTPGEITFAVNRDLVTEGVTLTDKEVGAAVAFAFRELKLVVEPSGAISLAALLTGKIDVRGKVAVAVLSGGNIDPALFNQLVA